MSQRPVPWPGPLEAVRLLAVAAQFLTRLPVPAIPVVDGDLRRATAAFPLVGVAVAGAAVTARAVTEPLVGPGAATVFAVLVAVAVTGAFHEDGLADSADGIWGGWDPHQRLEIMRDSRLGTYGACALILVLAARIALLAPLPLPAFVRAVVVGHVVSRAAILVMIRVLPPVRDQGHGARVAEPVGALGACVALLTVAAVGAVALGGWVLVPVAACLPVVAAVRRLARRRLGGLTGDVLGGTQQLCLVAVYVAVVALVERSVA